MAPSEIFDDLAPGDQVGALHAGQTAGGQPTLGQLGAEHFGEIAAQPPAGDFAAGPMEMAAPFAEACVKLAANRGLKEFTPADRVWPWGVILASHPRQSGAQQQIDRLNRQLRPILGGKRVSYVRKTLSGSGRRVYTAQIGYASRGEANAFCSQFRAIGGRCIVLKN